LQRLKQSNHITVNAADLASSDRAQPIRVLHVDDDPSTLEVSKQILMMEGNFVVDNARCVDEAFKKLSTNKYDIIVSDYEMPQKNGLEFLKELREKKNETPFILFTGKGREEVAIKALNLGVDGYFNKQGNPETVYGELAYGIIISLDRYQTRKELLERDTRILKLASQTPGMLFQFKKRPDGTYCVPFTSDSIRTIFGCSPQDVSEDFTPIAKAIFSEDLEKVLQSIEESALHLTSWHCEYRVQLPGQPIRWVWGQSVIEKLEDGSIMWTGYNADITENKKNEEILKESEERFRKLIENAPTAIYVSDLKGNFLDGNKVTEKMMGYNREELIGKNMLQVGIIGKEYIPQVIRDLTENLRGHKTGPNEYALKKKDGSYITAEISAFPVERQGEVEIVGVARDITEMKRAQDDLRVSERKYRTYMENSPVAFFVVNSEGKYEQVNEAACKLLGYSRNELLEMSIVNILFEEDVSLGLTQFALLKETGKTVFEVALKRKDGTSVYVILNATKLPEGKMMAFCENITERKKAEQALVEAKNRNQSYLDIADVMIVVISPDQNTVLANKKTLEVLGYSEDEILNKNWFNAVIPEANRPSIKKSFSDIVSGKIEPYKYIENDVLTKNGDLRLIAWHHSVLKDKEGNIVARLSSGQDITEQNKIESELKREKETLGESEAKLRSIVENSSDQIFMLDEHLKYLSVNKTLGDVLGKDPKEVIGKSINEVYDQETASNFSNNIKNIFETGKSVFMEEKMIAQGHELYISTSLNPVQDGTGNVIAVAGIVRDITERKKAEEAIKFQADLLNQVGQAVIMVDNNRIIRFWNKAAEKLYGWQEEQALGHQITELLGGISPEEADEVSSKLMAGESWSTEALVKNKDGLVVPVILNRSPIFKEDGGFCGAASITTDITLQKSTEADLTFSLECLSNSLSKIQELNEKLRVVGGLTRHDVRNKLSAVTGYAYLLKKKHADEADVVEGIGKMETAVRESMKIFEFAKMYEQLGEEELSPIDVEAKINEAKTLFSGSLPNIINDCHGLTVLADSFLRQMFYNFIDNTRKYGQKTSIIKVHYQKTNQGNFELIYEDDGVGISAENKLKLFSEGFSTGGSTGFGLFLTKKMIEVYGWKIEENGTPGEGAKFTITIPKLNKNGKENYQIAL
jgi:PAS domain S-box-containing protein